MRRHYIIDENRPKYCAILVILEDGETKVCMRECIKFEKATTGGKIRTLDLCPLHDRDYIQMIEEIRSE